MDKDGEPKCITAMEWILLGGWLIRILCHFCMSLLKVYNCQLLIFSRLYNVIKQFKKLVLSFSSFVGGGFAGAS